MRANVFQAGLDKARIGIQESGELQGVEYFYSTVAAIAEKCLKADLVIGAVLNKGARAPHVVSEAMIRTMRKGSVVVDVSIDQGGCIETSRATTHDEPIFVRRGVTHYCVTNMPGAYPRTSTIALCAETLEYIKLIADKELTGICTLESISKAINIYQSRIVK